MDYTSITADQREHMVRTIGVDTVDDLFAAIPDSSRFRGDLDIPPAMSELDLQRELQSLSANNAGAESRACFMGAGAYDHFIPTFIDQLISRGEFLTAYTPYQAEASQGMLQAFFEFQTQIGRISGMDVANSSLYEGATAVAEAVSLALSTTGKNKVLIASTLHPDSRTVLATHLRDLPAELIEAPADDGKTAPEAIARLADNNTACVVIPSPNFLGLIEDWRACFAAARDASTSGPPPLCIAAFNPIASSLLDSPGNCGADIAVGEGQPLGIPLSFGGPYLGLFAAKRELIRRMPGRLVGMTSDAQGRRAFALILQTREQHIRGARATSNICTNQGLLALRATMHMTALGPVGLRTVAEQCWHKAHHLASEIANLPGYTLKHKGHFFNEFVVSCPKPARTIIEHAKTKGLLAGIDLSSSRIGAPGADNELLIAVTEKRSRNEMDRLVSALADA